MIAREGERVRFTEGPLGLVASVTDTRFRPETVTAGDLGTYVGPHPLLDEDGWHVVQVGELVCPCHESQFAPLDPGSAS